MATLEKSELDIALERLTPQWLAGFFDGEGSISITMSCVNNPRLQVSITQSDLNLLTLIAMKYFAGNGLYSPVRKKAQREKRPIWIISVTGKGALPFLLAIEPHVILKRKLVLWAIEAAKLTGERGKCGRGKQLPLENRMRRHELMELVKNENRSGFVDKTLLKDKIN